MLCRFLGDGVCWDGRMRECADFERVLYSEAGIFLLRNIRARVNTTKKDFLQKM